MSIDADNKIYTSDKKMSHKKYLSFSIKLFITLFILYFVLTSVPVNDYKQALVLISVKPLVAIFLLVAAQVLLLAVRWYLLARAAGSHLSIAISVFGILMSFFFSQGLPASIGGDAFRLWWHRREGISASSALQIIFFDRVYGMLSLVLLCVTSVFLLVLLLGETAKIISLFLLIAATGILLGLMVMPWRVGLSKRLSAISATMPALIDKILQWIITTRVLLSQQKYTTTFYLLSLGVITHLLVVLQVFVVGFSLSPDKLNLLMCIAAVPPALLVSYMPFSIAGWGVRELSMVVAFGLLGVAAPTAILISLVLGMAILVFSLLGGLIWILGGFRLAYLKNSAI